LIKTRSIIFNPELDYIFFIPIGDFHCGDKSGLGGSLPEGEHATEKFRAMVKWIKDTREAYTFLMGDIFDATIKTSIGNVHDNQFNLGTAKEFVTEELRPIKDKILGCFEGNHEERILKATGDSPIRDLSKFLDIEYFPDWCAYLFFSVGESRTNHKDKRRPIVYSAFLHHMIGGGKTQGGKLNRLAALKSMALADLYCGAHVHTKSAFKERYIYPDIYTKQLVEMQQCFAATGSYMGYASYSLKGQYTKPATGSTRIRLNGEPEKGKDIHASI